LLKLMASPDEVIGPINLGNPDEFTIIELARKVIAATGSSSKIIHLPLPQDDPRQRQPDISKAKEFLDWSPTVRFDEGLVRTIDYFDKLLGDRRAREVAGVHGLPEQNRPEGRGNER
jgi:UDP-glucuronate decarboxylase